MKHLYKLISLAVLLLAAPLLHAQNFTLIMEMVVTEDGKKRGGAEVNVYRDGQFVEKVLTDDRGLADIPMKPGGVYTIEIGGNQGLIKKKLEINTKNVPAEDLSGETFFPAEVDIFKKLDGLDYNILNKPIGKIMYDPSIAGFDADRGYTKQMKSQLEELQENYLAKKEEEAKREEQKQELYDEAIKKADKALKSEQWEEAEKYYKEAAELMPIETYPTFQLAELETKLIKIRETNERYDDAIGKAEAALSSKDYQTAVAEFKRASGYKPDEEYPQNKLKEVQDLLANQAKVEQNYLAAIEKGDNALKASDYNTAQEAFKEATELKPEESYPKNKLAEIKDVLAKREAKEQEYQETIKKADEALAAKNYPEAKAAYEKAKGLKPTESYPAEQITKLGELMAAAAKKEQDYLAAVETADNALQANKLDEAKTAYEEASKIKPEEEYPKNKIKEIDQAIAQKEAKEQEYQAKIKEADQAFGDQQLEAAKTAYQAASAIKPTETYPQEKISEIDGLLAEQAKQEEAYQAAIAKGDQALSAEDYEAAKAGYQEALSIKADESYPQEKLNEIEGIVVKMQAAEEEYNKAIQDGDDALANQDYEKAIEFYQAASALKAEEQYPKDKIAEIEAKQKELAEKDAAYQEAITQGDQALENGKLEEAKTAYTRALSLKAEESYPQEKITEIEAKLAEQAKQEEAYTAAIAKGDEALKNKSLEDAKAAYEEALELKNEEQYPKDKIAEIDGLIAAQAEAEENYNKAIEEGDEALKNEEWEKAKSAYENALSIKEDDYPKSKIQEIEQKLAEIKAEEQAAAKLEADYQAAISEGDQAISSKEYDKALSAFEKALALKAEETYPAQKIEEIKAEQEKLAAAKAEEARLAKLQAQYDSLISLADQAYQSKQLEDARKEYQAALAVKSEESYPQEKIDEINETLADAAKQEEAYQAAIEEADKLLGDEKWEEAKAKYAEASSIKSEESYPKDKISEIEAKLAELAAQQEEIRIQQEKDEQYQALVAEADNLFQDEKLDEAKVKYEEALKIKDEQYPKDQISAIAEKKRAQAAQQEQAEIDAQYDALIAEGDKLFESADLDQAKKKYEESLNLKDEQYPKDQLAAIEEKKQALAEAAEKEAAAAEQAKIEAEYQALIAEADQLLEGEKLDEAKAKYEAAIAVKEEQYPKDQISAIEERKQALASEAEKEAAAAEQAKIDAEYQALIAEADQLLDEEKLDEAKAKYEAAIAVKEEQYPKDQISAIEERRQALAAEAEKEAAAAEQAKIDAEYQALISEADQLLEGEKLDKAKAKYEAAIAVKEEQYPKDQITAIEERKQALAANAEKEAAEAEKAKKEAKFQALIAEGDALAEESKLEEAKGKYEEALGVMEDPYPAEQIAKIEAQLQKLAEKQAAEAKAAKKEQDYLAAIEKGDQELEAKNYMDALVAYQKALKLKPEESYPTQKVEEINDLLAEQAFESQQNQAAYDEAMAKGEEQLSNEAYSEAISSFKQAQALIPEETLPAQKIEEAEAAIIAAKAKQEEIRLKQEQEAQNDMAYQTAITNADKAFKAKDYNEAENEYRLAKSLKPSKPYPQEQLDRIAELLQAKQAEKQKAMQAAQRYQDLIDEGDQAFKGEDYQSAKSAYQSALGIKQEDYPKDQLALIKEKLEEQKLSREEELKKMDEPIKIKKGPKATIDGDAEARIDAMYKEMWAKRNADKNELIEEKQELIKSLSDEEREKEAKKRASALEEIENIKVSQRKQAEEVDELHLQNYELVVEKEKGVKQEEEENRNDAKRLREDVMAEKEDLLTETKSYNEKRGEEIIEGKKEAIEEEHEEIKLTNEYRYSKQEERINEVKEEVEDKSQDIREFNQDRSSKFIQENKSDLDEREADYQELIKGYKEQDEKAIETEDEEIEEKQKEIREFEQERQQSSFKDGQEEVEEKKKNVPDYNKELVSDADERIMNQKEKVNDIATEERQFKMNKQDHFKDNQEAIEEKTVDLKEEAEKLNQEAEKRRQDNKDREFYEGEAKPRQDPESADYPQGVTEKIIENSNGSTTIRRIVVEGTQTDIYEKTLYTWGGIFYTKNGANITKEIWDEESR